MSNKSSWQEYTTKSKLGTQEERAIGLYNSISYLFAKYPLGVFQAQKLAIKKLVIKEVWSNWELMFKYTR